MNRSIRTINFLSSRLQVLTLYKTVSPVRAAFESESEMQQKIVSFFLSGIHIITYLLITLLCQKLDSLKIKCRVLTDWQNIRFFSHIFAIFWHQQNSFHFRDHLLRRGIKAMKAAVQSTEYNWPFSVQYHVDLNVS